MRLVWRMMPAMNGKLPTTRRRSKRAHHAILAATTSLLEAKGYTGLSIEAVAAQAGVGKQTIYRWWPSKAALVMEAYSAMVAQEIAIPDSGRLEEDLYLLFEQIFSRLSSSGFGKAIAGLLAEAQTDPILAAELLDSFIDWRRKMVLQLLEKGLERGEVAPEADLQIAVDSLFGSMWYRLLVGHAPLDQQFAKDLVSQLLSGIAPPPTHS